MTDPVRALARWCSLAVLVEPSLVRELRLTLEPELDVAAEGDLWWSSLVESRTTRGIVLTSAVVADLLGDLHTLIENGDRRPATARALVQAHHRGTSPAVQLEEEIAWLAASEANPGPRIEQRLRSALAALATEGRTGLVAWVGRALPRLPEIARQQPSAWYLEQGAKAQLPHLLPLGTRPPDSVDVSLLAAVARRMQRSRLGVLRIGDRLYFGPVGSSGQSVEVAATEPRIVDVEGERSAVVQVAAGVLESLDVGWEALSIRTTFGDVYAFPVWDGLDRDRLQRTVVDVHDESDARPRPGVVVGKDLVAVVADGSAPSSATAFSGTPLLGTEIRRRGSMRLLRIDGLDRGSRLPVRRLRRPPEQGQRWYGFPLTAGWIRDSALTDIPGLPLQLQVRRPPDSGPRQTPQHGPIVVDNEISGLVMSVVPDADVDGDLAYGNWSELWALLYPESAEASREQWLTALADLTEAILADLSGRLQPSLWRELVQTDEVLTDAHIVALQTAALGTVVTIVSQLCDAAVTLADPALLDGVLAELGAAASTPALRSPRSWDPREPTGPLDVARLPAGGRLRAESPDQERVDALARPRWRTVRDRLVELRTPGFTAGQGLPELLGALFLVYRRTFDQVWPGRPERIRMEHGVAAGSLAVLSAVSSFDLEQSGPEAGDLRYLEGRFDELVALFGWVGAELVDAVAAFDPWPEADPQADEADGYRYDVFISCKRQGNAAEWTRNHLLPSLTAMLDDELPHAARIFFDDQNLESGQVWPDAVKDALGRSKVMVAVLSPPYFTSPWCFTEWSVMLEREAALGRQTYPLIYPLRYSNGEVFPESARNRQQLDVREWNIPYSQFRQTSQYLEFAAAIRRLAVWIAEGLDAAPPWRPDFLTHVSTAHPDPPRLATLPRL